MTASCCNVKVGHPYKYYISTYKYYIIIDIFLATVEGLEIGHLGEACRVKEP